MDFRWKNYGGNLPNVQPNFVDPDSQGVRSAMASQQMAGYQPNPQPNMQGYNGTPMRTPVIGNPGSDIDAFYTEQHLVELRKRRLADLQELKERLAAIDAEIAKVKSAPMSHEKEMAVASKLAEIGDTSVYQAIINRQQNQAEQQRANASSIDNMLYEAEKAVRGLTAAETAEQRAMYRSNLEGTLRQAEEVGAKLGIDATQHPSYKRIEAALRGSSEEGASGASGAAGGIGDMTERLNKWQAKIKDGSFSDKDLAEVKKLRDDKTNSQFFEKLNNIYSSMKGKTKEDRERNEKRKNAAFALWKSLRWLDDTEKTRRIGNLTSTERELLEEFHPDILK